jgi:plastocyanin
VNLFLSFRTVAPARLKPAARHRPAVRPAAALLVLATILLATPPAAAKAQVVDIEAGSNPDGSMYLKPAEVTVMKGDVVTLRVHNPDKIFHDVALLDYAGNDVEIEVPAGTTEEHTFTATVAGDFRLICEVRNHKQAGMQGTLHVDEPSFLPLPLLAPLLALAAAAVLRRR